LIDTLFRRVNPNDLNIGFQMLLQDGDEIAPSRGGVQDVGGLDPIQKANSVFHKDNPRLMVIGMMNRLNLRLTAVPGNSIQNVSIDFYPLFLVKLFNDSCAFSKNVVTVILAYSEHSEYGRQDNPRG